MEKLIFKRFPILKALKDWDTYTYKHSLNVQQLSLLLGIRASFTENELKQLGHGALLHDIGKLEIPHSILLKPGVLTDEERAEIQTHPERGYSLVDVEGLSTESRTIILQHHENWDGSGYPNGVMKHEIHPFSQIVSVADVYEALIAWRVYAKPKTASEAIEIIAGLAGKKFNPEIIKLLCSTKTTL